MPGATEAIPIDRDRERLRLLIKKQSLLTGGSFRLASGKTSSTFFNLKKTMLDPEGSHYLTCELLKAVRGFQFDAVGGLAVGAVPLVAQLCLRSYQDGPPIPAFYVRDEPKDHGVRERINGNVEDGSRVLLVEDVTTTGGSAMRAAEAVADRDCTLVAVISVVDREEGARDAFSQRGIHFESLFTMQDILND